MTVFSFVWLATLEAKQASFVEQLPQYSKIYNDQADPFKDAVAAIKLAKATNRNVLIEIGGNWCTWCHKMDAFLAENPDVYQTLHQNFVLLKINVSDSNNNEAFMNSLPPVLGYPHMYVSTASGKMILSKDTAELLATEDYSRQAWLEFLNRWSVKNNSENIAKLADKVKVNG
ncbi:hypothetical protein tinsulaeT_20630 [Thalassotalea insulae]|uniref:Thioredoxin family protein n=2 Tax=Thalassotalea insulae TaxID=2056778 RepID=A0ABQ6GS02_9GAMM|nr:hypothetical protein tinsulaeT_20630 [Thalassotalea insulae]